MASQKKTYEKRENIRNYSVFIGLTFLIVFYLQNDGAHFWMGASLSLIPFGVAAFLTVWMQKNKP